MGGAVMLAALSCERGSARDAPTTQSPSHATSAATVALQTAAPIQNVERETVVITRTLLQDAWRRDGVAPEPLSEVVAAMKDVVSLLPAPWRAGTEVRSTHDAVELRGLPKKAVLRLRAQAPATRTGELFDPFRQELFGAGEGSVRYFAYGGTIASGDHDSEAHARLLDWLHRLPPAPDVDYVFRDFCWEDGRRDLAVTVVQSTTGLEGAFLDSVTPHTSKGRGGYKGVLLTLTKPSSDALVALVREVAPANTSMWLTWGDRVIWHTWASSMSPTPDNPKGNKTDLRIKQGSLRNCPVEEPEAVARLVRMAAVVERAR